MYGGYFQNVLTPPDFTALTPLGSQEKDNFGVGPLCGSKMGLVFENLEQLVEYPLVNQGNHGKSPCLMGKSAIHGHFQ